MDTRRLAWLLVALHVLVAAYGFRLNDEADQIAAFHNLANGSLLVKDVPPSAYQLSDNISWQRRWQDDRPIASTALNVVALPVSIVVRLAAAIAPLTWWFSGIAALAIWRATGKPSPWDEPIGRRGTIVGLGIWALLGLGFREPGPDLEYYGSAVALNVTSLALGVLGAILAWRVLGHQVKGSWRALLLGALVLGPWLYWARLAKYHMLSAVLVLVLVLLLQRTRTARRDFAIGVTAGILYWTSFAVGLVAILGLVTIETVRVAAWRGPRIQALRAWPSLALGGFVGLLPSFVENTYLFGNPFINFYFANSETSFGAGQSEVAGSGSVFDALRGTVEAIPRIAQHLMAWNGPRDFVLNLLSTLSLGTRVDGNAFGIFLISPLLVLAAVGAYRVLTKRVRRPELAWAICVLAWQALLGTNAGVTQGAGFDARLWFHALPLLAILAAFGVCIWRDPIAPVRAYVWAAIATGGLFLMVRAINLAGLRFDEGPAGAARYMVYGMAVMGFSAVGFMAGLHLLRGRADWQQRAMQGWVVVSLALPMVWTALFVVASHPHLPDVGSVEGGEMYVPAMAPLADFFYETVAPPTRLPMVWNETGTLVFHPSFGSCLVVPNPCPDVPIPENLRQRLENAKSNSTSSSIS